MVLSLQVPGEKRDRQAALWKYRLSFSLQLQKVVVLSVAEEKRPRAL